MRNEERRAAAQRVLDALPMALVGLGKDEILAVLAEIDSRIRSAANAVRKGYFTRVTGPRLRGFAAMSSEKRSAIAAIGGKVVHQLGKAHEFTPEEAAAASRKGIQARRARKVA